MITFRFCKKCQTETERCANGRCRPCAVAYNAAYASANKEKFNASSNAWSAANRQKKNATQAAYRSANPAAVKVNRAAWNAANPEKVSAYRAAWRTANPGKIKAANAAWKAANPEATRISNQNRRAIKRANGGKLSNGLAAKLFKLQRGKCACCGLTLGEKYHLDHIDPLALGGSNTDDNIQLLRSTCNNQKHAKDPLQFMQSRGFLL